ncbi:hypothetical protein SUGI_0639560 [Cryptomeria japonica]|nr:hypothetical protein SUGI_0639560 [Cryptomeria japonica]
METSVVSVEWAMSELMRNPATLAQAQQEMECAMGRNCRIKESDVMKLDYLGCVIKETFRLHSPLPLLIPHESMEGCSVEGYFIPPKTRVFVMWGRWEGMKTFGKMLIN